MSFSSKGNAFCFPVFLFMQDDNISKIAKKIVLSMAWRREEFKNRVEEYLSGALLEFYKARLAEKNGHKKWVAHWKSEVRTLLQRSLVSALMHEVKGFRDRQKAFEEVVRRLRSKDSSFRNIAENQITRDFNLRKVRFQLDGKDMNSFWEEVQKSVRPVFEEFRVK